ncbi:hypothetical protein HDU98_011558 [Podochytrium sp. JEL0797]|nr:hypothetical protein HDU98_011558 [Podochytrium sp. JEL0797]
MSAPTSSSPRPILSTTRQALAQRNFDAATATLADSPSPPTSSSGAGVFVSSLRMARSVSAESSKSAAAEDRDAKMREMHKQYLDMQMTINAEKFRKQQLLLQEEQDRLDAEAVKAQDVGIPMVRKVSKKPRPFFGSEMYIQGAF